MTEAPQNVELILQCADRTTRVVREAVKFRFNPFDGPLFWDIWLGWNLATVGFIADGRARWTSS